MKFGIRKPSIKRRVAARTSWKRQVRHRGGLKAPRGMGWATNPKKAAYNRVYNRTSVSADRLFRRRRGSRKREGGCGCLLAILVVLVIFGMVM
ncbi:MAG: hypothetical protein LAT83_21620 [Kiritimatiellae bacterium]|nr:hypothetical protein [Kiritimatiellia bacterium]